jgi:acetyl-CoA C-acetyltransferase
MRELKRRVAIVGVGQSPRNYAWAARRTWKALAVKAVYDAFSDANISPREIEHIFVNYHGEIDTEYGGIGPAVSDYLGLCPVGATPMVAQCTGGGVSIQAGVAAVASGMFDKVLVLGFDKEETDSATPLEVFNVSTDSDYDFTLGFTHLDGIFMSEQLYMKKYGYDLEPVAQFAVQDHWYAKRNPKALHYRTPTPTKAECMEEVYPGSKTPTMDAIRNRSLALCEGATALIVVPEQDAKKYTDTPIWVDGVSYKCTGHYYAVRHHYPVPEVSEFDLASIGSAFVARQEAFKMARIAPEDVDVAQVYDNQIIGILDLEALGICPMGEGGRFVLNGETAVDGRCPTCTDGGKTAFGMSSGADVLDGIVESVIQLRGEAGKRQVKNAQIAACVGFQGQGGGSTVTVLRR